jgi:hypothetical protein
MQNLWLLFTLQWMLHELLQNAVEPPRCSFLGVLQSNRFLSLFLSHSAISPSRSHTLPSPPLALRHGRQACLSPLIAAAPWPLSPSRSSSTGAQPRRRRRSVREERGRRVEAE